MYLKESSFWRKGVDGSVVFGSGQKHLEEVGFKISNFNSALDQKLTITCLFQNVKSWSQGFLEGPVEKTTAVYKITFFCSSFL
jgi:hypothetical protein